MIKKILVANRGEIACRVFRTAKRMGIATVAVYSEADKGAMHTQLADEAIFLGASEPASSYLAIDKLIGAAKESGADAIHPGYGFVSEKPEFAQACKDSGITFIGPSADAMRALGSKIEAKQLAEKEAVPLTPGYFEVGADDATLIAAADEIGYPVMLKASAGGGGRGMRVVRDPAQIASELSLARKEAMQFFSDDEMMVEKYIENPRHIEVQAIADSHGQVFCLFERECSLQRRHQKIFEEAPSPVLSNATWQKIRAASERLLRAARYENAGTIEFMYDEESGEAYFLEVNARLQVEHPVTEEITGLDLVELQIRAASGEALRIPDQIAKGDRSAIRGSVFELRIVAEDPAQGFLPSSGKILGWAEPTGPGIRVDTGYRSGDTVSRYYDSLVAKLIISGANRKQAVERAISALEDFHVLGVQTNIGFLHALLYDQRVVDGKYDVSFLEREFSGWKPDGELPEELSALFSAASAGSGGESIAGSAVSRSTAWSATDSFRIL